jgi:hypothetical protein
VDVLVRRCSGHVGMLLLASTVVGIVVGGVVVVVGQSEGRDVIRGVRWEQGMGVGVGVDVHGC